MTLQTVHTAKLVDSTTGEILPLISVSLTANTDWSPRFEGSAKIADRFTPNPVQYVRLTFTRDILGLIPLSEYTAKWISTPAELTTTGSVSCEETTRQLRETQTLSVELLARRASSPRLDGSTDITLTSCEMDLHDIVLNDYEPRQFTTTSLKSLVSQILAATGESRALIEQPGDDRVIESPTVWNPGESAWEVLAPHLNDHNALLWADTKTNYRLRYRTRETVPSLTLSPSSIVEFTPTVNVAETRREGTLRVIKATEGNGVRYEGTGTRGIRRATVIEQRKPLPEDHVSHSWDALSGPREGAAASTAKITAPDRLEIRLDALVAIALEEVHEGYVQHVTHEWPSGLMTLDLESHYTR